ncbi:MAG: T9SS type A sorting domain-containing protein [Bacteroidetes bacterium]|nr:T9SS type A sorting domain-containing protein [Bacteroidota bacterium]
MKRAQLILIITLICTTIINDIIAQTFDPLAVQVINTLIAKNQLQATPNAPETWNRFATWNSQTPKQLIELDFSNEGYYGLVGSVSLAGLAALQKLLCLGNSINEIDLTNCSQLHSLTIRGGHIYELDLASCTQLQSLNLNVNNISELDVTTCPLLKTLIISWNRIKEIDLTHCTALEYVDCGFNMLTYLNLSNCLLLEYLDCSGNQLTEIDLSKKMLLKYLYCWSNNLIALDVSSCSQLQTLESSFNCNLYELKITNCTALQNLKCSYNKLTELDVTNCKQLKHLDCSYNRLAKVDLTGLNTLNQFYGDNQIVDITLYKNEAGEYTCSMFLNNPTFSKNAISYSDGVIKSANVAVLSTGFTVQTNKGGFELSGTFLLHYDGVGLEIYDPHDLQVINNLIANNGLYATQNSPETWEFAVWDEKIPKQITELFLPTAYSGWPYSLNGDVSLAGLTELKKLDCHVSPKKSQISNQNELSNRNYAVTKLNVANCTSLNTLNCFLNFNLTEVDLTNCIQMQSLNISNCCLTNIDLSDCIKLATFQGYYQNVYLSLYKNDAGEYTRNVFLNSPIFGNSAISYFGGVLKSTNNNVSSTSFTVQTNKPGFELSGTMNFNYTTVGINLPDSVQLKVYPNPASEIVFIEYDNCYSLKLFDMIGREVLTQNAKGKAEINISHLSKGIYNVRVFSEGKVIGKSKIVKQ